MRYAVHPLRDAEITPAPEPVQVDPFSEAFHTRGGTRVPPSVRALPTMRTTRGDSRWTWGRAVDRPTNSGAPLVLSPSDLERKPAAEERANLGSMDELRQRLAKSSPAVRHSASLTERATLRQHTASGARHNAVDRESIQTAHDALSKLGAICRTGSQNDGNRNP
jgi:hypothetical protein